MDISWATNSTNASSPLIQSIAITFSVICETFSHFLLILLIVYRNLKKKQSENYHSLIFSQLFYSSAGIVAFRDICRIFSFYEPATRDEISKQSLFTFFMFMVSILLQAMLFMLNDTFVQIVLIFSFLAATQRIVIVYLPNYKFLVTGRFLKVLIAICWTLPLHYFWLTHGSCLFDSLSEDSFDCLVGKLTLPIVTYRVLFAGSMLATVLIFRHFYKLVSKLKDQNVNWKSHLLYQFVPIYTFLTIYTFLRILFDFIGWFYDDLDSTEVFMLFFGGMVSSFIPIVICFSYIASQDNLKAWITDIIYPIWGELATRRSIIQPQV